MNQPERLKGNSRRSPWLSRFALIVLLLAILHLIYLNLATIFAAVFSLIWDLNPSAFALPR